MEHKDLNGQIDEINRKLDLIIEEIEHQRRYRKEFEDLRDGKILWKEDDFRAWESYTEKEDEAGEEEARDAALETLATDIVSRTLEGW